MSTLPISSIAALSPAAPTVSPSDASIASNNLGNQNTFLQLLIAQLQNQDPEQPTDGTQFVTELAQFTTVQEDTQSATDLDSIVSDMSSLMTAAGVTPPANMDPTANATNQTANQ